MYYRFSAMYKFLYISIIIIIIIIVIIIIRCSYQN